MKIAKKVELIKEGGDYEDDEINKMEQTHNQLAQRNNKVVSDQEQVITGITAKEISKRRRV